MRMQLLVYLLLFLGSISAYSDYSYSIHIKVNDDGSSHITEKTVFLFENPSERKAFEDNMNLGESTIVEWKKFSQNIRYHVKSLTNNTKITAKREFSVSFEAGAVIVDYDTGQIFDNYSAGSRRMVYNLNPDLLAFDRTKTGQMSLGNNVEMVLEYSKGSEILKVSPEYEQRDNLITWRGPISGNWEFSFAREMPLSQEVSNFFIETYNKINASLPLVLFAAFSLLVIFVLVKIGRK